MRNLLKCRWAALPMLALVATACGEGLETTAPELDTGLITMSMHEEAVAAGDKTTVELLAGQDILVGHVTVTHYAGEVSILYEMLPGYCLDEVHWEATYEPGSLTNKGGNPQIGQFEYGDDALDCATTYTEGPKDITGTPDSDGHYIVAAHAVVVGSDGAENPHVVYGTFDQEGDGPEEGDIYGINPTSGSIVLVADIPNDGTGDKFDPNGLAIDRGTEYLFFVSEKTLYKVPAMNADPLAVTPMEVASGLMGSGPIRNATIEGGYYWYVPNGTEELWRIGTDGSGNEQYCSLNSPGTGLYFGDIAADPGTGTIYGTARIDNGTSGDVKFFVVDVDGVDDCASTNSAEYYDPLTFQLQLAFGPDGTLYGQQAISEPQGDDPGQWYELDKSNGQILATLAQTTRSFTDITGGLPFEPVEFEETAWADGLRFTERGSWATYMGPFFYND